MKKDDIQLLILDVLSAGALHGYAITRELKRRSEDALEIGEGSLYPILRGMEREELVSSLWELQTTGPARRVYKVLDKGQKKLASRRGNRPQLHQSSTLEIGGLA